LKNLKCYSNQLTTLDVSSCPALTNLNCSNNQLLFSKLPLEVNNYSYSPQKTIDGGNIFYKFGIDLRDEYNITGNITQFAWFDISDGDERPLNLAEEHGMFSLTQDLADKRLRCKMTNATFPLLNGNNILVYEVTIDKEAGISRSENGALRHYPNPTSGILFIECEDMLPIIIKIYDILGREVKTQNAKTKTELDISHLPAGIYCVKVIVEGKIINNSKIVKQ
jgi:hypothetical protein